MYNIFVLLTDEVVAKLDSVRKNFRESEREKRTVSNVHVHVYVL